MDLKDEVIRIQREAYDAGQVHVLEAIQGVLGKELGKFGVITLDEMRALLAGLIQVVKQRPAMHSRRDE